MSTFAANNITTWFGGYDMTADTNQTTMPIEYEALISTTMGPAGTRTAHSRVAGLESVSSQVAGFAQFGVGLVDEAAFNALGGTVQVITHSHDGVEGSPAYFYQSRAFTYQVFGDVGQLTPFNLTAQASKGNGSPGAIRGAVLKTKANVVATGATGTGNQLGAVAADQFLYAALHVFGVGTTITAVLESDDNSGFTSATTRATFGPITAAGGTWATRVPGAITDTWYRLRVTAITGTFSIACVAGIK
ncbi:hypothetical protein OHB44_28005 [Micromonospora sp. NBC_00821]|uniref:hypothetical protein n=1 Tax=Micromonospora sp. NBC_00821 TaxID=2975977 RepID=UPI002ED15D8F|nr:hypothetical protein OHB44_28005 [Micromonospora sp. NBC_00821]